MSCLMKCTFKSLVHFPAMLTVSLVIGFCVFTDSKGKYMNKSTLNSLL